MNVNIKHFAQGSFVGVCVMVIIMLLCNCASMTGSFDVSGNSNQNSQSIEVVRFPDGKEIPDGYEYLTTGEFKSNAFTMKCDYEFMVNQAEKAAKRAGGDAFRLFNIKKPDYYISMCYSCNILILKKKSV